MSDFKKLYYNQHDFLAYQQHPITNSQNPNLVYLGGFMADMYGTKASAIAEYAQKHDYSLTRFDYFGHGLSSGTLQEGTIGLWLQNSLNVIDQLTGDHPLILIGSSMGGWLMLLAALARPNRIAGLIGLASAPDFTENLIYKLMTAQQKEQLAQGKQVLFPDASGEHSHLISHEFIEDGRNHLLLNNPINISSPIRLIHGMADEEVPYQTSIEVAKLVTSQDVQVTLIKGANHRLSSPKDLGFIYKAIEELSKTSIATHQ